MSGTYSEPLTRSENCYDLAATGSPTSPSGSTLPVAEYCVEDACDLDRIMAVFLQHYLALPRSLLR